MSMRCNILILSSGNISESILRCLKLKSEYLTNFAVDTNKAVGTIASVARPHRFQHASCVILTWVTKTKVLCKRENSYQISMISWHKETIMYQFHNYVSITMC